MLSAAVRTGERFGAHHLADILVGAATDKVLERGHQHLPTFGVGRDHDRDWWLSLIRALEAGDCLVRGDGRTAGVRPHPRGQARPRGPAGLPRRSRSSAADRRGTGAAAAQDDAPAEPLDGPAQEGLFQCLRAVRLAIARSKNLPPYIIFSDKTLRSMAQNRPTDDAGLLRCHGVGEVKLEAYGPAFLAAIREWSETGRCG